MIKYVDQMNSLIELLNDNHKSKESLVVSTAYFLYRFKNVKNYEEINDKEKEIISEDYFNNFIKNE